MCESADSKNFDCYLYRQVMQSGFGMKDGISLKDRSEYSGIQYISDNNKTGGSLLTQFLSSLEAVFHIIIHDWHTKQERVNRNFLVACSSEELPEQRK